MKKAIIFVASLAVAGLLMTSCGSTQECPAYSQAVSLDNVTVEVV